MTQSTPDSTGHRTDRAVHAVGASLERAGWTPVALAESDRPVVAYRTSVFRWRWMATRLHTVAVTMPLRGGEDRAWFDAALAATVEQVRRILSGVPLGFQSGISVVVTLVGEDLDPSLRAWAEAPHGGGFAVIVHPVLADVADGGVVDPPRRRLGGIYHSYLRGIVAQHVTPHASPAAAVDGSLPA